MKNAQLSTAKDFLISAARRLCGVLDMLFPPRCISCKKEGAYLCGQCRAKIPEENAVSVRGVVSLWRYENKIVRKAVWLLKYRGRKTLARDLAEAMYDKLLETVAEDALYLSPLGKTPEKYLLIPVPISKERRKRRGYNQAELLAKEIAARGPDFFTLESEALIKEKDTPSQVSVRDRQKRLRNIHGSFSVQLPEKIAGRRIIIIDDVATTGATVAEARRVLLKAGAKYVLAMTLAH